MKRETSKRRSAQIWVETVVYTLIGLSIIAIVLAIAAPSIERYKDQLVVEQTLDVMKTMGETIEDARYSGAGNIRTIPELRIKKGKIEIDPVNEEIKYILEGTRLDYSQPGQTFTQGEIKITTEKSGKKFNVYLNLSYNLLNITFEGNDEKLKILNAVSVPYKLTIENQGEKTYYGPTGESTERIVINIKEIA